MSHHGDNGGRGTVTRTVFTPPAERRSALDRAHRGDIEGAWGTVRVFDTGPRRSWRRRAATLLAVMGPGLIVMAADNDAGGLSLYAQAGQSHGFGLLWLVVGLTPVLFVNQEMVARLGAVTGAGHARLIFERFGRQWGWFAVADLIVLNLLTLVTEFIGVSLALGYFGVDRRISVPVAAVGLIAVTARGSFRGWERAMFIAVLASLLALPLLALTVTHPSAMAGGPHPSGHPFGAPGVVFAIALIGTTVAPWQLFLQQSNVVDKRVTPRWLSYARLDTAVGTVVFAAVAVAVLAGCAVAFAGTEFAGGFVDAGGVATGLGGVAGWWAGALFSVALLNGSLLGAAAVTLATSYAIGDATGLRQSLHRSWRDARTFHGSFAVMVVAAAVVVLIPDVPLGLLTVMVNVLAGVLLPSATIFLLLLCNDVPVLGPWVNPIWLNLAAAVIVAAQVALSALLVLTTLFPTVSMRLAALVVCAMVGTGCAALIVLWTRRPGRRLQVGAQDRLFWTMPPLDRLAPPPRSAARVAGLVVLRCYLLVAGLMVAVRAVQLAS